MGAVDRDLRKHLADIDEQESLDNYIEDQVANLMKEGAEYYPFSNDNFYEALTELDDKVVDEMRDKMINNECEKIGEFLMHSIVEYWANIAETKIIASIEDADCKDCFDEGCPKCDYSYYT